MATGKLPLVHNARELTDLVLEIGILPFTESGVEGFSVEACTPKGMWFVRDVEGPWEWREQIADAGEVAYGKLLRRKAAFVSPAWYGYFANWRRGGMTFEERYEAGLIPRREKDIMDMIQKNGPMLAVDMRAALGKKGFDGLMMSLQMRTDLLIQRMDYRRDAFGRPYGMGRARYAPSEAVLGEATVLAHMDDAPEASLVRIAGHIQRLFPGTAEKDILRLVQ